MKRYLLLASLFSACTALQVVAQTPAMTPPESAALGDLHGVTRDSQGSPVAAATVVARNLDDNTDRIAVSGVDGAFKVSALKPGRYELTAQKDGGGATSPTAVQLAAQQSLAIDVTLSGNEHPSASEAKASPPVVDAPVSAVAEELAALKRRIGQLEAALQARTAPAQPRAETTTPAETARALPPELGAPAPAPQQAAAPPEPATPRIPEALQTPDTTPGVDNFTPFAYADWTWLNGTARTKDLPLDTKFFTPEVRFDTHYMVSFNQPKDDTLGGSTQMFRNNEVQLEQISVGGDFHWQNVRGRILTMYGMFAHTTPRNDASPGRGQWDLRTAYRYVSEAWGGYHFNVNHGLNVDAGIFVSYIGLFSYYNFDNWAYQPSYVSSNTPWFFNGVRVQWFPTNKLKIEPWFVNGWQSYARFGSRPGLGGQILWRPKEWLSLVFNNYGMGEDTLGGIGRSRIHTDDSVTIRYYNKPEKDKGISKMAFSFTADAGCEYGGGVSCRGGSGGPQQSFLGWMAYNRMWFNKDKYAFTLGGGSMSNPGRYLTLLPPINGADAISGSPYFTYNSGDKAHMWDASATFDYMPKQYITFRWEAGYRHSDVPYFSGRGGITPPGGNNGHPNQFVCNDGSPTSDPTACGGVGLWRPDLRRSQAHLIMAILVKF